MAEPNWKPCVHSVQPRLVYRPPTVKTGAPLAGSQDFSMARILAADRANIRRTLGSSAPNWGADCVSTIPRNFNLSGAGWYPARRLATGASWPVYKGSGGLPTRRRLPTCPTIRALPLEPQAGAAQIDLVAGTQFLAPPIA